MKRAKLEKASLWGVKQEISPAIIEEQNGDGETILWFCPMDTRPNGYYLKIDSSYTDETPKEKMIDLIEPWVFDSIIEECGCDTDEEFCDNEDYAFPVLHTGTGGYSWHIMSDDFKLEEVE